MSVPCGEYVDDQDNILQAYFPCAMLKQMV